MVLTYGVTVTQKILVLLFEVRILIGQQRKRDRKKKFFERSFLL